MSMIMNLLGFPQRSSRSSELTPQAIETISMGSVYRSYIQGPEFVGVVKCDAGYASRDPDTGLIVVMGNFSQRKVSLLTSRLVLRAMEIAQAKLGDDGYRIRVEMGSNTSPQRVQEILQGMVSER